MGEHIYKKSAKKRITAKEIARLAGVSQSTVSRVFNQNWKGTVKADVKERILKIASETGYTRNTIAHILTSKSSGIVGIVVSREFQHFYYEVLSFLAFYLSQHNIQTMLFLSDPKSKIDELFTDIIRYQLDGIIITSSAVTHDLCQSKRNIDIPAVLYNGLVPGLHISVVHSDNYSACIQMADYLVATGHHHFAYISTANSEYSNYQVRQEAFLYGLSQHGIHQCQIIDGDYSYASGFSAAKQLLTAHHSPDAIFCSGDLNAMGAVDAARSLGLVVGRDVSITAFDAPCGMEMPSYGITALHQNVPLLAEDAVRILLDMIETGDRSPVIVTRPMELIVRTSSPPLPVER